MKKLSLLVALALLVSFGAFAQVSLDYSVTGSATMTWGIELDEKDGTEGPYQSHGFKNETASSFDMTVTLDPSSYTKGGEGVYGEITLSGFGVAIGDDVGIDVVDKFKVKNEDGDELDYDPLQADIEAVTDYDSNILETGVAVTAPDVAAKVVLSDALFLQIASKPDFDYNYATTISDNDSEQAKIDTDWSGGVKVGYMSDLADVNLNIVSAEDYENNYFEWYSAGLDASIKAIDMVTIGLAYAYIGDSNESADVGETAMSYLGASLKVVPMDMLTLNVGYDMEMRRDEFSNYNVDVTIPVKVTDAITVTPRVSFANETDKFNDAEEDIAYEGTMDAELAVAMTGDIAFSLTATAKDMLAHDDDNDDTVDNAMTAVVEASGSYKYALSDSTYVKPGFTTKWDMRTVDAERETAYTDSSVSGSPLKGSSDDTIELSLYCEASVIDNTVFTLKWANDQVIDSGENYFLNEEVGIVTFETKISY